MPPLHPNYRALFRDLVPFLKGWRATVDASTQDRQVRRYINECDAMITMKEMQHVKQSESYTDGERYLLDSSEGKKLTFEEFALVWDLLLVKFALLTGTRPAPLNNTVLEDFQTAREERGRRIILVPKHTRSTDGPAMLGMNQELQRDMAIYVQKIRPHFANPDEDKIFVKDDGYGFKKGMIGRLLTEFFAKTGVTTEQVSHTKIRKFIATRTMEDATPKEDEEVEKMMGHSVTTRQRCYVRTRCTNLAPNAMDIVDRVTNPEYNKQKEKQTEDEGDSVDKYESEGQIIQSFNLS